MLKRIFSLMLAFVMVFSLLPIQALAEGTPETEGEHPVQETEVPAPETEPEAAETEPAETKAATEPQLTEPTEDGTVQPFSEDTKLPDSSEDIIVEQVTFCFNVMDNTDDMPAMSAPIDETFEVPEFPYEIPGYTLSGWTLERSDGTWLSANGQFEENNPRKFKPGETILIRADLFDDDVYDYVFHGIVESALNEFTFVFIMNSGNLDVIVEIGNDLVMPGCTEENPGYRFHSWHLWRDDGAFLASDGTFVTNQTLQAYDFFPGDTLTVDAPLFDFGTYSYHFSSFWNAHQYEDGGIFLIYNLLDEQGSYGFAAAFGETVIIPDNTFPNHGHDFSGWFLLDDTGAWLTENGSFTLDESIPARRFLPGEEFTIDKNLLTVVNGSYSFHSVWENTVVFNYQDGTDAELVEIGTDFVMPVCAEENPGFQFLGWSLLRSDYARLQANGTFQSGDASDTQYWLPGDTLAITSDRFDGSKYTYTLTSHWNESSSGDDYNTEPITEEDLRSALQTGGNITIGADITLTDDLTIPANSSVYIHSGVTLTVPQNIALYVNGSLYIHGGTLKIAPDGVLCAPDPDQSYISVNNSGTLDATGADTSGVYEGITRIRLGSDSSIFGIPTAKLAATAEVRNYAQIVDALALAPQYVQLHLLCYGNITIPENLEIPDNTFLTLCTESVWDSESQTDTVIPTQITIASGAALTSHSNIMVNSRCILTVSEGAHLIALGGMYIDTNAILINNGTITAYEDSIYFGEGSVSEGTGEFLTYKEPGVTEDELRAALNRGETVISITENIALTRDLTIPKATSVYIKNNATLTVPAGISLIIEGDLSIENGTLKISPDGILRLVENSQSALSIGQFGHLDVSGADISGVAQGCVNILLSDSNSVSGIPTRELTAHTEVCSMADLKDTLAAAAQYYRLSMACHSTITITEDLTFPANVSLQLLQMQSWDAENQVQITSPSCITIASGVSVMQRGHIYVGENCTLTLSENSKLLCAGSMHIDTTGKLVNNGTITEHTDSITFAEGAVYEGIGVRLPFEEPPHTEESLRAELNSSDHNIFIELTGDITLTRSLIIPRSASVVINKNATLTVPEGAVLTVEGELYIDQGSLKVSPGAALRTADNDWAYISVSSLSLLDASGAIVSGVTPGTIQSEYSEAGNVFGIPTGKLSISYSAKTYDQVRDMLALAPEYYHVDVHSYGTIVISQDLEIPHNAVLWLYEHWLWNESTETYTITPSKLTFSSGVTVINEGEIYVSENCNLTLMSGSQLTNRGYLSVGSDGTLVNNGTITTFKNSYDTDNDAIIKGSGKIYYAADLHTISSFDPILAEAANGVSVVTVFDAYVEVDRNVVIPKNLKVTFVRSTVSVWEGATLTCDTDRALSFTEDSRLNLDGTFKGKEIFLSDDSAVVPEQKILSSKIAEGGRYVKLGIPKVSQMFLYDGEQENTVSDTTVFLDMSERDAYQLTCIVEPLYAMEEVTWKSSSSSIAAIDQNGFITLRRPGTVTITATSKDGTNKRTSVILSVIYVDPASKITAAADIPASGLEYTTQTTMLVYGENMETPLDPAKLTFSIPANQQQIATVDENGIITAGSKTGTASVTATLSGDPLKRKVTLSVKVIPLQTASLSLIPEAAEPAEIVQTSDSMSAKYELYLDKSDVASAAYTFQIQPSGTDSMGNPMDVKKGYVKWTSTDTRIATVKENGDGSATVTVKAKSDGICAITAVANDLTKLESDVTIYVRDYTPRLESTSLTLNTNLGLGVSTALVESYGNHIAQVSLHEYDNATRAYVDTPSERFDATYEDGLLTIIHKESMKNSTNKLQLRVCCADGNVYTYTMSLKVANTLPAVTIKQPVKLNLFYSDSTVPLEIAAKDAAIDRVELDPGSTASFTGAFDSQTGMLTIGLTESYLNKSVKLDTSATLLVYLVGYKEPVSKNFTIGTVTTKPSLNLTPASSIINTKISTDLRTVFTVYNKTTAEELYLTEDDVKVTAAFASSAVADGNINLTLTGTKGGTATVEVQCANWTQAIKLTHKVTVQTALPTPTLGASTLKLNRIFTETEAETTIKLNQNNQQILDVEFKAVTKGAENIVLDYENGIITASFAEGMETAPKNGNYKFDYVVILDNDAQTRLAKKSITVNVHSTVPTAKLAATTLKLNKDLGTYAVADTQVTLTKGDGYRLVDMELPENWNNPAFEVEFDEHSGKLSARLLDEDAAKKNHTVNLEPVLVDEATGQKVKLTSTVKLTVSVYTGKISLSVSAKGKLDTMDPNSAITYTVSKLNNIAGSIDYLELRGTDHDLFSVALDNTGSKPVAVLTLRNGAEVATNKTYKLQLVFGICNQELISDISVKVSQTALKFATIPALKLYQSQTAPVSCAVVLTTPVSAQLGTISLNSKTDAAFLRAMGRNEMSVSPAADGRSAEVSFKVEKPGYLVNGKSYTIYLDITPENNASNVKPTQLKLTVKVSK